LEVTRSERRAARSEKRWEYREFRPLTRALEWKVPGESGTVRVYGPGQSRAPRYETGETPVLYSSGESAAGMGGTKLTRGFSKSK